MYGKIYKNLISKNKKEVLISFGGLLTYILDDINSLKTVNNNIFMCIN